MKKTKSRMRGVDHLPKILALDGAGNPSTWITYREVAYHTCKNNIIQITAESFYTLHGGISRLTGEQSILDLDSIVMIQGEGIGKVRRNFVSRKALFMRDSKQCAYCGHYFVNGNLEVEHVMPQSRGGRNIWTNLVSACNPCNNKKGDKYPHEAGLKLLWQPHEPNVAEWLILTNPQILPPQFEYLSKQVSKASRFHRDRRDNEVIMGNLKRDYLNLVELFEEEGVV